VQLGQNGHFVFVVKEDMSVDLRPVEPGQKHGVDIVVSQGLQAGETVVVSGQLSLSPGATVRVVER